LEICALFLATVSVGTGRCIAIRVRSRAIFISWDASREIVTNVNLAQVSVLGANDGFKHTPVYGVAAIYWKLANIWWQAGYIRVRTEVRLVLGVGVADVVSASIVIIAYYAGSVCAIHRTNTRINCARIVILADG